MACGGNRDEDEAFAPTRASAAAARDGAMTMAARVPRKSRELCNHHLDSRIWNAFEFRPGDVIVATYPKSGTTWMQQIVAQLVFAGAEIPINRISPWMDSRLNQRMRLAALAAQRHPRILKSHLPLDALVYSPRAKYIYVARDGRDVVWSLHHNHSNATELYYRAFNDTPGRIGPPIGPPDPDIRRYFRRWLDEDGFPFWPYFDHVGSWWEARGIDNILIVHFSDLSSDLEGEMRRIAAFLGAEIDPARWTRLVERCTFSYMKEHAQEVAPFGDAILEGGPQTFINKGKNGRWAGILSDRNIADYEAAAREKLGAECAAWLAAGFKRA
ncbi:MAG TPA: sulfotransferase domain-containing protein [Sphingomicrobium sp.]|nr:sulfotransferase domain-containing protein [Sphingomicrobium sp.]